MCKVTLTVKQKREWLLTHGYRENTMKHFIKPVTNTTNYYYIDDKMTLRVLLTKDGNNIGNSERIKWSKVQKTVRELEALV